MDSNVILDVVEDDPQWCDWSLDVLNQYSETHQLIINPVIYAEVSISFERIEEFEEVLSSGGLKMVPIPKEALFLAGKVFIRYRRKQGVKTIPLPDFFIGAHAAVADVALLTRDKKRFKHYFPSVKLVSPK
ncbi:MAG: PIN domain-containing protein [Thiogranum sp.]